MRVYFFIIVFVLTFISSQGQESILKLDHDKQYQLYFIDVSFKDYELEDEQIHSDSIRNGVVRWDSSYSFLIDDELTLKNLQTNWTGKSSNEFFFCWYNYFIYVIEDNKIVDELHVNEECKQVVCKHGVYNYSTTIADKLDKSKIVYIARVSFDSLSVGRQFYKSIKNASDIISPPGEYDEWIKYDGTMRITTSRGNAKKIQRRLEQGVRKQFPKEVFEIEQSGSGPDDLKYSIYCTRNIGDNLKGYKVWLKWKELNPSVITLFSTTKTSIEGALKKYAR